MSYSHQSVLSQQNTPDILYKVGSLDIPDGDEMYLLHQVNQTHLHLFGGKYILTLDISNYMFPRVVGYTNFSRIDAGMAVAKFLIEIGT